MPKTDFTQYDKDPANNTDVDGVDIAEGCAPSGINNAIRSVMSHIAEMNDGTVAMTSPDINGGTIDGVTIGGTTAGAGTFTTGTFSGNLTVDTNTLFVDSTNNRVGIGTNLPAYLIDAQTSSGNAQLGITSGGDLAQIILTSTDTAGTSQINFADADSSNIGMLQYFHSDNHMEFTVNGSERMRIDSSGNVGIGTSSPTGSFDVARSGSHEVVFRTTSTGDPTINLQADGQNNGKISYSRSGEALTFSNSGSERARIDSSGNLLVGKTTITNTVQGVIINQDGQINCVIKDAGGAQQAVFVNRQDSDGTLILFRQANLTEGSISVSGSTVSYNGGHLARWSRLADDSKDTSIVKGTVMTNLDAMVVWSHDAVEAQDAVYETVTDEEGNETQVLVSEAVEAKEDYTEDNEQLNKMAVSSVEGDPNVAGVFVNWDEDDDDFNDMNIAMTGDMVIRIAQGTTVARGDLLMSAGDGTAKPQGDDIVRSKTIAKVTSTNISHTYDDGSYLVPCVLMAC